MVGFEFCSALRRPVGTICDQTEQNLTYLVEGESMPKYFDCTIFGDKRQTATRKCTYASHCIPYIKVSKLSNCR